LQRKRDRQAGWLAMSDMASPLLGTLTGVHHTLVGLFEIPYRKERSGEGERFQLSRKEEFMKHGKTR
jgi:hypothetical protein